MIYHNKSSSISSSASTSSPSSASAWAGSALVSLLSSFFDWAWYAKSEALTSLGYYWICVIYFSTYYLAVYCRFSILLTLNSSPISRIARVNWSSSAGSTKADDSESQSTSFNEGSPYPTWLYFSLAVAYIISLVWLSLPICTLLKIVSLNIEFIVNIFYIYS